MPGTTLSASPAFSHLILTTANEKDAVIITLILQTRKLVLKRVHKAKIKEPINKCLPDFKT